MCYGVSQKREAARLARQRGDFAEAAQIERDLENLTGRPLFHVSGFIHPELLVYTNESPNKLQSLTWGLIPSWTKTLTDGKKFWNNTLNARGETIFEKPSFKSSAKNKRCLIYLDAFYEHHHANKQTYPFRIEHKDKSSLIVAGLWEEWVDKSSGEILKTFTIVTTEGNPLMSKIHNNPNAEMGPRMPVILEHGKEDEWLIECKTDLDKKHIQEQIRPYAGKLNAYTVAKLLGKEAAPNTAEIENFVEYPDLKLILN